MTPGAPLLLAALAVPAAAPAAEAPAPAPAALTYLILPFENVAEDPSLDWLSTGLALVLAEDLLGLQARVVDDDERSVLLEGSGIPSGAPLTLASALELGRKMRARAGTARPDRLVLGRYNVEEGRLTISARSIDLAAEKARPWISREGRLKNLLEVQTALALALARDEGLPVSDGRSDLMKKQVGDLPLLAFETYCRAMAEIDAKQRLQLLRRAVQEYPGYPKAIYQAASLLVKAERWDEAAGMLERAAAPPHPYEADSHLLAAAVALQRGDPQAAAAAARHALDLADTARAHLLLGRALLASGDRAAAQAELDRAAALDPAEPEIEDLRRALDHSTQPARRNP